MNNNNIQVKKLIEICIELTEMNHIEKLSDQAGFVEKVSCYTNRMGISKDKLINYLTEKYGLKTNTIQPIIETVYSDENEFCQDMFFSNFHINNLNEPDSKNSPTLPKEIYEQLPQMLKRCTDVLSAGRQQDMFLLSAFSVLGGCMKEYSGLYDGKQVFSNLYSFIVAPAASGKGVMDYAKKIGKGFHEQLVVDSHMAMIQYEKDLAEYTRKKKEGELDEGDEKPEKPPMKLLFVPGNSSTAAIIEKLSNADERLVIFETEADTLSSNGKNQWSAGMSEILRAAFHHEPISSNRKGMENLLEIFKPKLSIAISGTDSQVARLIQSTENGLYSRFLFYTFNETMKFRDVSPNNPTPNKDAYYETISESVKEMGFYYEKRPVTFSFTTEQWERFNHRYQLITDYVAIDGRFGTEINGIISRNGIAAFRIAMILTAIRKFQELCQDDNHLCNDMDFKVALQITETLLTHSIITLKYLPKAQKLYQNTSQMHFYNILPKTFTREEAITIGKGMNLSPRSCDGYLKKFLTEKKTEKLSFGNYAKC